MEDNTQKDWKHVLTILDEAGGKIPRNLVYSGGRVQKDPAVVAANKRKKAYDAYVRRKKAKEAATTSNSNVAEAFDAAAHKAKGDEIQARHKAAHSALMDTYKIKDKAEHKIANNAANEKLNKIKHEWAAHSAKEPRQDSDIARDYREQEKRRGIGHVRDHVEVKGNTVNEDVHRIGLTVTDPNHPMVSKRKETIHKTVRISGVDRENAINTAIAHYRRKGYKVHDHHYIGKINEGADICQVCGQTPCNCTSIAEGAYEKSEENKRSADAAKKHGNMFDHHLHMSDYHENLSQWHSEKGRHSEAERHSEKAEKHHEEAMKLKEDADPCWDTHKQIGMKMKGGKKVPNCVPKESVDVTEAETYDYHMQRAQSAERRGDMKAKVLHLKRAQAASNQRVGIAETVFQSRARLRLADALRKEQEKREAQREAEEARRKQSEKPEEKKS